jgi:hypothetical protein
VSPEDRSHDHDALDEALMSRHAAAPPPHFTAAVLARVNVDARRRRSRVEDLLIAHGVHAGIACVALGVSLGVDFGAAEDAIAAAVRSPAASVVVGVMAICAGWVLTRQEPEAEAL